MRIVSRLVSVVARVVDIELLQFCDVVVSVLVEVKLKVLLLGEVLVRIGKAVAVELNLADFVEVLGQLL